MRYATNIKYTAKGVCERCWGEYQGVSEKRLHNLCLFLFTERPRSRCYWRTAALRLIVQPCDEDEVFFLLFHFNGAPVEWNWQGKTEVLGEKPVPVPLCPFVTFAKYYSADQIKKDEMDKVRLGNKVLMKILHILVGKPARNIADS